MIETMAADQISTAEVLDKKNAAIQYCKYATAYTTANDGKPRHYYLIPQNIVKQTSCFKYFVNHFSVL